MTKKYFFLIVSTERTGHSLHNLNGMLEEGWRPVRESPMGGGAGDDSYSLVLLEKHEEESAEGKIT